FKWCLCFFFFQAEDGIRDFHVTGVQTCALPISREAAESTGDPRLMAAIDLRAGRLALERGRLREAQEALTHARRLFRGSSDAFRSEERRVGKEGRSGRGREAETNT